MTRPQEPLRGKDEIKLTKWGPVRIVMVLSLIHISEPTRPY